jgi:activator of HSP90 ATPase
MAKFDAADPRWIVRDREDGRNVNMWHWDEKDINSLVKEKLSNSLTAVVIHEDDNCVVSIKGLDSCEGEASLNQRKGKKFVVYDLIVKATWEG